MRLNKTSNPAFTDYFWNDRKSSAAKMTVTGIIFKSLLCIAIIAAITVGIWKLYSVGYDIEWFLYGGIISSILISIVISYKNNWAPFLVPVYAIAKGCFLGGISSFAHAKFPNMPYQAIGVTIITFFTILFLYQTRIIVVTQKLKSIIITAAASIFLVYIISWILSFFGIQSFIGGTSLIAIAFNIIAAIVASLTLLLDFQYIERQKNKATKNKEWLATWGLLVSLVWLYVEILRLMKKFAIR
ncbi:Bax inhibitor-1/YccA family protein [Lacinutrix sp. C3R15]|uniref:Bax inhibitor-1/YccA family protein n=1 Tax=Flavobacteriaceae TaxID=49546 RepID=UPI001C096CC1|nr:MULTISPECIES: Bax inhibitor-1/YccA family protein [Flavobacteriaceae]MBU2939083.1 Bax inhibitor-1/YccA family protein [Lacinutrix sp. C3R15]MDO6622398.1 Bax inhibitor-1/YccA family protein [Oceanihabitans sp. 1_MG-2023]